MEYFWIYYIFFELNGIVNMFYQDFLTNTNIEYNEMCTNVDRTFDPSSPRCSYICHLPDHTWLHSGRYNAGGTGTHIGQMDTLHKKSFVKYAYLGLLTEPIFLIACPIYKKTISNQNCAKFLRIHIY